MPKFTVSECGLIVNKMMRLIFIAPVSERGYAYIKHLYFLCACVRKAVGFVFFFSLLQFRLISWIIVKRETSTAFIFSVIARLRSVVVCSLYQLPFVVRKLAASILPFECTHFCSCGTRMRVCFDKNTP